MFEYSISKVQLKVMKQLLRSNFYIIAMLRVRMREINQTRKRNFEGEGRTNEEEYSHSDFIALQKITHHFSPSKKFQGVSA